MIRNLTKKSPISFFKLIKDVYGIVRYQVGHIGIIKEGFSSTIRDFKKGEFVSYHEEGDERIIQFPKREDPINNTGPIEKIRKIEEVPESYIEKIL